MILYEMELLLSIDFSNSSPDVEFSKHFVNCAHLLFHFGEEGSAFKGARDRCVPVAAVFSENILVLVEDKFIVGVSFGDKEYEFLEKYVIFVCFLEICVKEKLQSR